MEILLETERTILREIDSSDAAFMVELLNDPAFVRFIGDRDVRTETEAAEFIDSRYRKSYLENDYGLYAVVFKGIGETAQQLAGICGFVKRENFTDPDLGFAFLPDFRGRGLAYETSLALLDYGRDELGFERVLAITTQDNEVSENLLLKLNFTFETLIEMPNNEVLKLFSRRVG